MRLHPRRIVKYVTAGGVCPFDVWFDRLRNKRTQAIVAVRLNRVVQGNFGNSRNLGGRLWELKIDFGPGLRIYFGEDGDTVVVILCGGDKSTQSRDIEKARTLWREYRKE